MEITSFDWDRGNIIKCQKHGVEISDIEGFFKGQNYSVLKDVLHSNLEPRYLAIGQLKSGRHVLVVFTIRLVGIGLAVRPISARYMHDKEIHHYETRIEKATSTEK